jgi:hypothetical protein
MMRLLQAIDEFFSEFDDAEERTEMEATESSARNEIIESHQLHLQHFLFLQEFEQREKIIAAEKENKADIVTDKNIETHVIIQREKQLCTSIGELMAKEWRARKTLLCQEKGERKKIEATSNLEKDGWIDEDDYVLVTKPV